LGADLSFVMVNERLIEVTGYSRQELLTKNAMDLVLPEDRPKVSENRRKRVAGKPVERTYEFRIVTKQGRTVLVEASLDLLRQGNEVLGVQGIFRDVTQRWEAEQALRDREENYRQLFEGISDVVIVVSPEQQILAFNEVAAHHLEYTHLELLALNYRELCPVWDMETSERHLRHALEAGEARWESERIRKDGVVYPVEISARRIRYQDRPALILISRDITQRKDIEETLRSIAVGVSSSTGEEFFEYFVRHLAYALRADFVCLLELGADRHAIRLLAEYAGSAAAEGNTAALIGASCEHLFRDGVTCHPQDVRQVFPQDEFLEAVGGDGYVGAPLFDRAGEPLGALVAVSGTPIANPGSAKSLMSIYAARAGAELERSRAERALRASEERLRTMFEGIDDAMFVHDFEGRLLDCNAAACRRLGYTREELLHMRTFDIDTPGFSSNFRKRVETQLREGRLTCEGEHRARDGRVIPVDIHTSVIEYQGKQAVLAVIRDITERKHMEEENRQIQAQMLQAQKLESLGVLAGGIAHDFNNLLMGVLGNASLAMLDLPADSPARQTMIEIETAALRAGDLAKQMLAYSGRGKFLVQTLDLSELIMEMGNLVSASVPKKTVVQYRLAPNLSRIEADVAQMRQLVMNLVTNAADAIGDSTGTITVTTGGMDADRTYLQSTLLDDSLAEGPYVFLEVHDTGAGMDAETRRKIFDPFFSTKFLGRGLGLAAVLGIVRSHGGAIKVESEVGSGTTFRVLLPASQRLDSAGQPHSGGGVWRPNGAILVVDDEESVRVVAQRALERQGFRVLTANDGFEGLELFRNHLEEIALVLLDVTMPLMGGLEVFQEMRALRGDVRVLLSSGYSEQEATERFTGMELAGFIQKPYRAQELIAKVATAFEAGAAQRD
ncbi:MAG: PAS domain S-box protein, partial [Candidatus Hydrogenedentes bacterium]|nr:PAS domain S-box protein [Candidatus Hydrogenedentota bacterium]